MALLLPRLGAARFDSGTERLADRLPAVSCAPTPFPLPTRRATRDVSSWLPRAVVAAEDQRYEEHPGYDLDELAASLSRNRRAARAPFPSSSRSCSTSAANAPSHASCASCRTRWRWSGRPHRAASTSPARPAPRRACTASRPWRVRGSSKASPLWHRATQSRSTSTRVGDASKPWPCRTANPDDGHGIDVTARSAYPPRPAAGS